MKSQDYLINHLTNQIKKCEKKLNKLRKLVADQSSLLQQIDEIEKEVKVYANLLHDVDPHHFQYVH